MNIEQATPQRPVVTDAESGIPLGRRAFLKQGTLVLASAALSSAQVRAEGEASRVRVGLVTDLHHADKPPAGTRHYRETLAKLDEAAAQFARSKPDFIVELGDLVDAAPSVEVELGYLRTIHRAFAAIGQEQHYVLGNHCVDTLTKQEFLDGVGRDRSYYAFDRGGIHFIVLDACFRSDGEPYGRNNSVWTDANIPAHELDWLQADLDAGDTPTVVFAHQRLDEAKAHSVKNHAQVRAVLEASGRVRAVLQDHSHKNDLQQIGGIHYCTLVAMVEGAGPEHNGYAVMDIEPDGTIRITGYREQKSYEWPR